MTKSHLEFYVKLLIKSGQHRAYILSDEGHETTIYQLFDWDIYLFSASCMTRSAPVANYTNEIIASRFSDVMWLIEQILRKSLDKRISAFLLEEMSIEQSSTLNIANKDIVNHIGTP